MLHSKIRRGELDREVTFIRKVISTGASNADNIDSWIEVATDPNVMARKKDLQGQDVVENERLTYAQRTLWTLDYRTDITIDNRLVYGGRVYQIIAVPDNEGSRERYIDVMTNLLDAEQWT